VPDDSSLFDQVFSSFTGIYEKITYNQFIVNRLINWNIDLTEDDILRGQGADPQIVHSRKPSLLKAAERLLVEGPGLIQPMALTEENFVREHRHERIIMTDGAALTGPFVTKHLSGALRVVAAVCTIGSELEDATSQLFDKDPLYALALDGLANPAVENLAQQVCGDIAEHVMAEDLQASSPLSPGNPAWPVDVGQPQIFSLLEPSTTGVSLTPGGMMTSKKSVSFVVELGPKMTQAKMCSFCSLNETCGYRNA
jgi:hypothetical protein